MSMMKRTSSSSVVSLVAAGVLMGGCMADVSVGEEVGQKSESEQFAAGEPNVGGGAESEQPGNPALQQSATPSNAQPSRCYLFKGWGQPYADVLYTWQGCGNSGSWVSVNRPDYPGWMQPSIDGVLVIPGWATTKNTPVAVTTSAAAVASFTANTNARGSCALCVDAGSACTGEAPHYWPSNGNCYPCPEGQILQPSGTGVETCQPRCAGLTGAALTACQGCSVDGGVACRCNQFPPASRSICSCLAFGGGAACYPPPPSCDDGLQNQGEQGFDCGGPCPRPCDPPTCDDAVQNQNEQGMDCGGPCEAPCPMPTCDDGDRNQGEEGIDCGGPCPTPCFPTTCLDGFQDQGEEGIDCGGPCTACPTCEDGKRNQGEEGIDCGPPCAADCPSPTCADGRSNQGEQGIDCGGPCPTACDAPTCQDGKINQGEEGVDCGGPCENLCPLNYTVQVRRLSMPPLGYHEDVCVDNTCYTSGPLEGNYRRDPDGSDWVLTDADGWSTVPGLKFKVTKDQRDMLTYYMDAEVVGTVSKTNFLANFLEFFRDGFCILFSRTHFTDMQQIVGLTSASGGCFCSSVCENCTSDEHEGRYISKEWMVDSESMCRVEVVQEHFSDRCILLGCGYATQTTCSFY